MNPDSLMQNLTTMMTWNLDSLMQNYDNYDLEFLDFLAL